jgi:hypothetical protein
MNDYTVKRQGETSHVSPRETKFEINRAAFSPAEFAGLFGRHLSWAYRRIYAGDIRVISPSGSMLIPATEVQRLLDAAHVYEGGDA